MGTTYSCDRHSRSLTALLVLPLAVLLALFAVACGDDPTPTPAVTAVGDTSTAPVVVDGEHFGFLVDVADDHLLFDPAEFLTGDEALEAALADGYIGPGESLDSDFYIRNLGEDSARLEIDPTATFTLLVADATGSPVEKAITYADLVSLWAGMGDGSVYYSGLAQGFGAITVPMNLTVSGGRVTSGSEQYLP